MDSTHPTLSPIYPDIPTISWTLSGLDHASVTGPDGISAHVLKSYSAILVPPRSTLFSLSSFGGLPSAWKSASITPIQKQGAKQTLQTIARE